MEVTEIPRFEGPAARANVIERARSSRRHAQRGLSCSNHPDGTSSSPHPWRPPAPCSALPCAPPRWNPGLRGWRRDHLQTPRPRMAVPQGPRLRNLGGLARRRGRAVAVRHSPPLLQRRRRLRPRPSLLPRPGLVPHPPRPAQSLRRRTHPPPLPGRRPDHHPLGRPHAHRHPQGRLRRVRLRHHRSREADRRPAPKP